VKRIRSDQDGSIHCSLPSGRECAAAYVGGPWEQDPRALRESGVTRTHRRCGHGCCLWPWPPLQATVGGGPATASPSEGPEERHTALQLGTS
jgi:hypothetical protein